MSSVYMFNCLRKINCIRDLLYLALALTYIIGTAFGVAFTKYVKCLPLLLLLTQMHAYRRMHILVAMSEIAITFGAIGDVLLEIDGTIFFLIGAASFFIGHLFFISGFIATIMRLAAEKRLQQSGTDIAYQGLNKHKVFLGVSSGIFISLAMLNLTQIGHHISNDNQIMLYFMPFYATALCMLIVTSLLLFSAYCHANRQLCLACLRVMLGSVFFFLSDNLLAAAKFNNDFIIDREVCSVLIMVTYYSAQMLIAKGAVRIAALNRGHF